ncbi:hypothetical protein PHJA_002405100 [Phtheirospermum japonicum]|uniref:Uncharacterized protein n=1 Tax=Phtheirospermum japonicum TaxID=374723 RepID=A0A830CRV9_9LAMI|nr:hypothetical protein PHJA_002405100 [Phtheirospermum japonicum]
MEATFVNQLNKSLNLLGRSAQKNCQSVSKTSKHKFKVLRDGRWSKTDFRKGEAEGSLEEGRGISENPWIQHYRCSERQANRRVLISRAKDPSATNVNPSSACNFRLWRQDSVDSKMTDQNFNEEDVEEEKCGQTHEMKRTRTSIGRVPSNDQVVPFENIIGVDDVAEVHARSED